MCGGQIPVLSFYGHFLYVFLYTCVCVCVCISYVSDFYIGHPTKNLFQLSRNASVEAFLLVIVFEEFIYLPQLLR